MDENITIVGLSSKKTGKTNWKIISAIIGIVVLSVGVIAGIFLVKQQQDIREKAGVKENCPGSEICSGVTQIMDCSDLPEGVIDPNVSDCNRAGRIEICGGQESCCPSVGGKWTRDMSKCSTSQVSQSCGVTSPTGMSVENLSPTSVKVKWTPGAGGGVTRLWVSSNLDPTVCSSGITSSECVVSDQSIQSGVSEYVVNGLNAETVYYWRLMSWVSEGCDSGSAVLNFTTLSGSGPTATASATATATATSTSTSSSTATATSTSTSKATTTAKATSTSKSTSTGTAFPVPETGADFPTILGLGFGVVMVLVSLALAL